jgi:hypothetical protein
MEHEVEETGTDESILPTTQTSEVLGPPKGSAG